MIKTVETFILVALAVLPLILVARFLYLKRKQDKLLSRTDEVYEESQRDLEYTLVKKTLSAQDNTAPPVDYSETPEKNSGSNKPNEPYLKLDLLTEAKQQQLQFELDSLYPDDQYDVQSEEFEEDEAISYSYETLLHQLQSLGKTGKAS